MAMHVAPASVSLPDIHPLSRAVARSLRPQAARSALSAGLLAMVAVAGGLQAATFTVTNTNDAGAGSLRQAVSDANANPGADEVVFDASVAGTIGLSSGEIAVTESLTVAGPGRQELAVTGDVIVVVGEVGQAEAFTAEISGLALDGIDAVWQRTSGWAWDFKGPSVTVRDCDVGNRGIVAYAATLVLEDSTVTGDIAGDYFWDAVWDGAFIADIHIRNSIVDGAGIGGNDRGGWYGRTVANVSVVDSVISGAGGVGVNVYGGHLAVLNSHITDSGEEGISISSGRYTNASLTIQGSRISGNTGSGIYLGGNDYANGHIPLKVTGSTIAGNGGDGVILLTTALTGWTADASRIENSTISGNGGVGVALPLPYGGELTIANSTISGNSLGLRSGVGYHYAPVQVTIDGSVIAGNATGDIAIDNPDYELHIDYSLVEEPVSTNFTETVPGSNIFGVDPRLGPLADNGGLTPTHALLPDSPAIDTGDPGFVPPPEFDQRGEGFDRVANGRIDMGAFEAQEATAPAVMYDVATFGLVDGNATPDIGVLRGGAAGESSRVVIKDSLTKQSISEITFDNEGNTPIGLAGVDGLGGGTAVAALFARPTGQGVVQLRDAQSGALLGEMLFVGNAWQVQAITSIDLDRNGREEIAVLATADDANATGVQIRDAIGDWQANWVGFPVLDDSRYLALTDMADVNGNRTPELAALRRQSDGTLEVLVKDSVTKQPVSTISFGQQDLPAVDLAALDDIDGNAIPELAVLFRKPNGQGLAQIRDGYSGDLIQQMQFVGAAWDVLAMSGQDANLDGAPELSVLAVTDDGNTLGVQIRDATTAEQVNWVGFPAD